MSAVTSLENRITSKSLWARIEELMGVGGINSEQDLATLVEKRLPVVVVYALLAHGLTKADIDKLIIARRTLSHRIRKEEPLSLEESDRAVRLARAMALAEQVFADREKSLAWLRKPQEQFRNRTPLELLKTEAGAHLVTEALYQIDEGIFG